MAFQLEAMLIERNGGIGGGGKQWINLGVVPEIDPNRNLWIAIPAAPGAIAGGSGRAGGDSSFVGASGQAPGVASRFRFRRRSWRGRWRLRLIWFNTDTGTARSYWP